MSERPFMQLYVSDFLGDTLDLSTEGIGAYMLLLMAMWNAGGTLPDDEAKLARITRMSVKKWRAVATDLMGFFGRDKGRITHQRLSKELRKSESKSDLRAAAGERGGRAKALKDKNASLANANPLPQHLPEARSQIAIEPTTQQTPNAAPMLLDQLCDAAGFDPQRLPYPSLLKISPIVDLIAKNYSLDVDILPAIREAVAAGAQFSHWNYFTRAVIERAAKRNAIPVRPVAPTHDWQARINAWRKDPDIWIHAWGPKPDEPGCKAPPELLRTAA